MSFWKEVKGEPFKKVERHSALEVNQPFKKGELPSKGKSELKKGE